MPNLPVSNCRRPGARLFLAGAACAAIVLGGCDRQSGGAAQPSAEASPAKAGPAAPAHGVDRSHKGSALPDLTLADAAGGKLSLASLKGKPFLLNLWATWCAPCVKELPALDKLAQSGAIRVVAVSQDSGDPQAVGRFLNDRKVTLAAWLDPQNDLSFHYGTGTLPTSVLYDSQGREVWRFVGEHDWAGAEARALIAEAR